MVAAEPREFSGVLRRARQTRAVRLGAHWARSANLAGNEVLLVTNGAGRRRAAEAVEAARSIGFTPGAIASVGFCGALAPDLGGQATDRKPPVRWPAGLKTEPRVSLTGRAHRRVVPSPAELRISRACLRASGPTDCMTASCG